MPHPQSGCRCHCRRVGHWCQLFSPHRTSSSTVSRFATCSGLGRPPLIVRCGVIIMAPSRLRVSSPPAGLQKIHLRVPAGAATIRVVQDQMPCLTDIRCNSRAPAGLHAETSKSAFSLSRYVQTRACSRLTSYKVLKGLDWLDLQQVAAQLTSLSLNHTFTHPDAYPGWQGHVQMLAGLAQLSELRHLDTGNCTFLPADGALCIPLPSYVIYA